MRSSARGWSMWFSARADASTRSVKSRGAATRMRICISARLARLEGPPNCTLAVPIGVRMITNPLLLIAASTLVGIAGFAGLLHLIPRLGAAGTRISAWLCRAPGLDLVVSLLTWIPPTVLGILYGWRGVAGVSLGEGLGMVVWIFAPRLANPPYVNGPRILAFPNRTAGRVNTHVALFVNA